MFESPDILSLGLKEPVILDELELLQGREKQIPGSWQYSIRRYNRLPHRAVEDIGMLVYHFRKEEPADRHIELKFCLAGNTYCQLKQEDCDQCRKSQSASCDLKQPTIDMLSFRFKPVHLTHFAKGLRNKSLSNELLSFRYAESFSQPIPVSTRIRFTLEALLNNKYTDALENIFINAQTQILLLHCLESLADNRQEEDEIPACKFLANEADRDKIIKAREILIQHIGDPITIKELSRKVAINECYLKKGFKVLFGTTIFDFYQDQRMEHAKFLLYEKGMTVSEVSALLGYSSISHFSTAFKKHTGLKPCELLVR